MSDDLKNLWYAIDGGDIASIRKYLYQDEPIEYQPRPVEDRFEQLYDDMEGSDEEAGNDVIHESRLADLKDYNRKY